MKNLFIGVILGAAIAFGLLGYRWKQNVDLRGYHADMSYAWLSEPVLTTQDGKKLSRAQLLDLLLTKALKQTPSGSTK